MLCPVEGKTYDESMEYWLPSYEANYHRVRVVAFEQAATNGGLT